MISHGGKRSSAILSSGMEAVMARFLALVLLLLMVVPGVFAADVAHQSELAIYDYSTDTVQKRENVTEYEYYNTTLENGTTVQERNETGWHFEAGQSFYTFDVETYEVVRTGDKTDVPITLVPNNLTRLLDASKEPWKSIDNRTEYFNDNYYFRSSNITPSEFSDLEDELESLPVYLDGELVKTTNLKDKEKNVTVKVRSNGTHRIEIGNNTQVVAVSGGSDDSYDKFKSVNVTSASGTPTISKAQPVILTCGDDSTTGQGDIVINCSSVDGVEDVDFSNTTNHRLDFEWEQFNLTNTTNLYREAVAWVYNDWTRDDTEQLRVHYGSGSTNEEDVTGTWGNTGQNAAMVQHYENGNANDSTSNDNDGTITGTTTVTGQYSDALEFDGTDDKIEVPDSTSLGSLDASSGILISTWYKGTDGGAGKLLVDKDDPQSSVDGWFLGLDGSFDSQSVPRMLFRDTGGNTHAVSAEFTDHDDGNWHHIVGSYDGSTLKIFIDGSLNNSISVSATMNTNNNNLGLMWDDGGPTYVSGDQDEVKIYKDDGKSNAWVQADYEASPKGGQVFFSQQAGGTGNAAPSIAGLAASPDPVEAGNVVNITADVTDSDGNLDQVRINLTDAGGNKEVDMALMSGTSSSTYFYEHTTAEDASSIGTWQANVTANDTNDATTTDGITFTGQDTQNPTISYNPSSTGAGTFSQDWILVNVTASDNIALSLVRETFDGTNSTFTNNVGSNWWENHTGLADGTYTVRAWANDTSNNFAFTSERSITLDTTAPTITLHEPRNITYNDSNVPLNVTADEVVDTWTYNVGSGNNTFTPNTTLVLSDGQYTIRVYANDSLGNTAGVSRVFTVDTPEEDDGGGGATGKGTQYLNTTLKVRSPVLRSPFNVPRIQSVTVVNDGSSNRSIGLEVGNSAACNYLLLQESRTSRGFGLSWTGGVEAAGSQPVLVRVRLPSQPEFETLQDEVGEIPSCTVNIVNDNDRFITSQSLPIGVGENLFETVNRISGLTVFDQVLLCEPNLNADSLDLTGGTCDTKLRPVYVPSLPTGIIILLTLLGGLLILWNNRDRF